MLMLNQVRKMNRTEGSKRKDCLEGVKGEVFDKATP